MTLHLSSGSFSQRVFILSLGILAMSSGGAAAQSIDDLFNDPEQAIVEEDPLAASEGLNLDKLVGGSSTSVGGSVNLRGGFGLYLNNYPGEEIAPPTTALDVFSYSVGYTLDTSAYLDVRPNSYTRFFMSLAASLDPSTFALAGPSLGEMFVDYTYNEKISFRAGKFTLGWGQAGISANVGDLVARAGGGTSLRAFIPFGMHGLTLLSYARADLGGVSPRNLSYAALFESTFGSFVQSLSAHYRFSESLNTVWSGRQSFGLLNIGAELRADWNIDALWAGQILAPAILGLVNFSHEIGTDPIWRFGAEYFFSASPSDLPVHILAGGLAISNFLPNEWRPGLSLKHALMDHSGELALGFDGPFVPGFKATIGLSIPYGTRGTYFRPAAGKALAVGMDMTMTFSY